eukprot:1365550-Pleurochrysis_carterae.AAC.1
MSSVVRSTACGWVEVSSIATVWPARTAARTASPRLARARPATPVETQPEGMPAGSDIVRAQE